MVSGIIIWIAIVAAFIFVFRKHVEVHFPIFMLKNKGLGRWIYKKSKKHTRAIKVYADVGIVVGLLGVVFSVWFLANGLLRQVLNWVEGTAAPASVSVVIPGVKIPGSAIYVPLLEGLIAIAILAIVHEFAHAAVASALKLKPKSVALVIMAFIPAAGVELDEDKIKSKLSLRDRLRIYSAGSFTNFLIGGIFLTLTVGMMFFIMHFYAVPLGMKIATVENNTAAYGILRENMTIVKINNEPAVLQSELTNWDFMSTGGSKSISFYRIAGTLKANQTVVLETDDGRVFNITAGSWSASEPLRGRIGISSYPDIKITGGIMVSVLAWFFSLFGLIATMNLGVGLFNLYPLSILDGGRIVSDIIEDRFPKRHKMIILGVFGVALFILLGTLFPTLFGILKALLLFVLDLFLQLFRVSAAFKLF